MPSHSDAIGFLNELSQETDEPWFKMVCDLVSVLGVSVLDEQFNSELFAIYTNKASYVGIRAGTPSVISPPSSTTDFLEKLSNFQNFKLLGNELELNLTKRISVIFGTNGSGKSSLCESLKVLAKPESPLRPLHNVRPDAISLTPQFQYKFRSNAVTQNWSKAAGFGARQGTLKYFDTALAVQIIKSEMQPGRVVALFPFKLHVFEHVNSITIKFRETLQKAQAENAAKLELDLREISRTFEKFEESPLAQLGAQTVAALPEQIRIGEMFTEETALASKISHAVELEKATSEEGLKLVRTEYRELELLLKSLTSLINAAVEMWSIEPAKKAQLLIKKQFAQAELASTIISRDENLDLFLPLLRAGHSVCNFDNPSQDTCPLCKQTLEIKAKELFKRYHEMLVSQLETEINSLKVEVAKATSIGETIVNLDRSSFTHCSALTVEILTTIAERTQLITGNCNVTTEPSGVARSALETLKIQVAKLVEMTEAKKAAIDLAVQSREVVLKQLVTIRSEIDSLKYAQAIKSKLDLLKIAQRRAGNADFWNKRLPSFSRLLKSLTDKAKYAYEKLVVPDFESRLNDEYVALAEKPMAEFRVVLARKGADASVNLLPKIGGHQIESVLSEGEQRLHSLALYFAELKTSPQSVLVFDDPISSFDYNYVTNYCRRLRDFSQIHPDKQIIIMTHSWEFFVQIQTTLKQAQLESQLSVLVLENRSSVANYSEKIDELKTDISAILNATGEPSEILKEETAGKMRRLMEAVVNTHVFANQRYQFKQKALQISAYLNFTKVVALLPAEATIFGDLYGKLSITVHDDPRNAYVNTDKLMFRSRYDQILAIEAAIVSRRP